MAPEIKSLFLLIIFSISGICICNDHDLHLQYTFKPLTIDQGLSNNRTTGVTQDSRGFIWIGTDDGISRFDGINIKNYNTYNGDSQDQWNQQITSVFTDKDGNLWKGALNLFIFNYNKDIFERFFPNSLDDQPFRIRGIQQAPDGWLWIGARNGMFKINPQTKEYIHLPVLPLLSLPMPYAQKK